jgi:hypothetical protein
MMMITTMTTKEWDTPSPSRRVGKSLYQTYNEVIINRVVVKCEAPPPRRASG